MQTLIFNTVEKTTELKSDIQGGYTFSEFCFDNVSTVAVRNGFYEIMQKRVGNTIPVARLPIDNTNMLIIND